MENLSLTNRQLEELSPEKKKEYFLTLREYCQQKELSKKKYYGQELISKIYPLIRNYDLEIIGEENLPEDDTAIIICNHSNSHNFFTAQEAFSKLGLPLSVFAASDCLSPFTKAIFSSANATLIDRRDKTSATEGTYNLANKVLSGLYGVVFGEATWNLHPYLPMQPLKIGGVKIAAIAGKKVVPTIVEYIEIPDIFNTESKLYSKCIVYFGKPISISPEISLISQTALVQKTMEEMRLKLWQKLGIEKFSLKDVNQDLYLNHTYLKKFKALGFVYDSENESKFLYQKAEMQPENEYHLDDKGNFTPGIINKKDKVLKK